MTTKNDLAEMYQRTAAVWREDAREWRVTAETMPDALKFIALRNAEWADQQAQADETRAAQISGKNKSTICLQPCWQDDNN